MVADTAARLLRPAGFVCVEHADVQGESAVEVLVRHGAFRGVRDHLDLNGRPRFVTAVTALTRERRWSLLPIEASERVTLDWQDWPRSDVTARRDEASTSRS